MIRPFRGTKGMLQKEFNKQADNWSWTFFFGGLVLAFLLAAVITLILYCI